MIKNPLKLISASAFLFVIACSSTDKKVEPPPVVEPPKAIVEPPKKEEAPIVQSRSIDSGAAIEAANEKLTKVPMMGLPPFAASLSAKKLDAYGKKSLEAAKEAVADMPEGYVLQITGHANQHPDKSKRKGNGLSVKRAKIVYDYFIQNGIDKDKLSYRGVGSSEPDANLSRANNRRITFKIIKAEEAGEIAPAAAKAKAKPKKKPDTDAEAAPESAAEGEVKPAAKIDDKPAVAPVAQPEAAPDAKPEVKPEAASDAKPEVKPETAPDAKPEMQP